MIGLKKRDIKKALKAGAKAGGVSLADVRADIEATIDEHPYWRVRHKMACKILMGCDMELAFPNPAFHDMEGPLQQQQYFADARG